MDLKHATVKGSGKVPNPRAKSNLFKVLTLTWTLGIFNIGRKRALEESDIFEPLKEHASANLGGKFSDAWNEMQNKDNPKLYKLLLTYFRWEILLFFTIALIRECVVSVSQPLLLGNFMSYYEHIDDQGYPFPLWPALALVLFYLLYALMAHPCVMAVFHLGLKCRVACCSLIFRKSLRISKSSFGETSVGQIVNLLSNDIGKFDNGISLLSYLIISPVQALIMTYFIWREIGMSAIIGVLVLVLMIPFQMRIAKIISALRLQTANLTDKRVQLTNEVISGVQVIKMYAWEERFNQLVVSARKEEIGKIRKKAFWRGITNSIRIFNTRLCMAISMVAYVLLGNQISARKLFITASFYEILKRSMSHWFPEAIIQLEEMIATLNRMELFLFRKEHGRTAVSSTFNKPSDDAEVLIPLIPRGVTNGDIKVTNFNDGLIHETQIKSNGVNENALVINDISTKWIPEQSEYTLRNITLNIPKGSFVAICGPVGSGKSSLLYAILKELPCIGDIQINGKLSYAAQEPWLFAGTIKQNIVFGSTIDEDRYRRVCKECSLEEDFSSFPAGDLTTIGERGITLSGGQKARVNLARAVYAKADIYLLDDPLSAVDARVGKQLLHGCIEGMLKDKTVLLVTHQVQCLRRSDLVVTLKAGAVESFQRSGVHLESNLDFADGENWGEDDHLGDSKNGAEKIVVLKEKPATNENKEKQAKGTVKWKIYTGYILASGSKMIILTLLVSAILNQFLASGFDYWNKYWVNVEKNKYLKILNATVENTTLVSENSQNISSISETELTVNRTNLIGIYCGILLGLIIVTLCVSDLFFSMTVRASKTYHNKMLRSITRAKMSFFHANPSGRILNRLSQDVGSMDEWLPIIVLDVFQFFLQSIGIVSIITIVNYYIPLALIVVMVVIEHLRKFYIKTSRSVKRLEGITRSPVFSHLGATIQGVVTIRSMGAQEHVIQEFDKRQDPYTSATYMFLGIARAFSYWLDLICFLFSATVTLSFLWLSGNTPEGIGLAVSQVIGLTTMFQMGIRQTTALENQMIGVERIQEYIDLDREPPLITPEDKTLPKNWPTEGRIEFKNVSLKYDETGQHSIRDVSFCISPLEKIGVVGRTGAGKTSIINALFRLAPIEGRIEIDGVDTSGLGLHTLRGQMSIIPQEPVLFSGTMKTNLDPFNAFTDERIWNALEQVELKTVVSELPAGLHCPVDAGGSNFSVGQRQLICIARAILHEHNIIILDEATANIDNETDALIQRAIRIQFAKCTIITVAHRLQTIMDSDKVMVMDGGKLVEFDSPLNLLSDKNSFFSKLVEQTGTTTSENLKNLAQKASETRREAKSL